MRHMHYGFGNKYFSQPDVVIDSLIVNYEGMNILLMFMSQVFPQI